MPSMITKEFLSGSGAPLIANAQMIGGVAINQEGAFQALPAYNSTTVPSTLQPSVLRSEMSGSQTVIHALNKLAASIDSSNDLGFSGDSGSDGSVALASQTFAIVGTSNEVETTSNGSQQLAIGLPNDVTIGGTLTATTAVVPAAAGGATLGSATAEFGGLFLGDNDDIQLGLDQDYKIGYDEATRDALVLEAKEGAGFSMFMMADNGDDAGDEYSMNVADGGVFTLKHDKVSEGTQAATLTITPGASAAQDVAEFSGIVKVGSNIIANSEGTTTITMDTDEDITVAGDVAIGGGVLTFNADATIVDQGGHTRIEFTDSGNLLFNDPAGGLEMTVADGAVTVAGDLTVTGNDIKGSGGTAITMDGSNNVAIAGDLTVTGNDIKASDGTATITMSARDVTVQGDLTVGGNDIKDSGGTVITFDGSQNTSLAGNVTVGGNIVADADENKAIFAGVTTVTNTISIGGGATTILGGDVQVNGTEIDVDSASAMTLFSGMGGNILRIGSTTSQNILGSADGVSEGVSIGLKAATGASQEGGAGNAKFMSPVTASMIPGIVTKKDAAFAISSSINIIGLGSSYGANGELVGVPDAFNKMIPFLSLQGADASGVIKDYKVQISGGILQVTEYEKIGNIYS